MTAGVVGAIANLALWVALHVLFSEMRVLRFGTVTLDLPVPPSLDLLALARATIAALALFQLKRGVLTALGVTSATGLVVKLLASR